MALCTHNFKIYNQSFNEYFYSFWQPFSSLVAYGQSIGCAMLTLAHGLVLSTFMASELISDITIPANFLESGFNTIYHE